MHGNKYNASMHKQMVQVQKQNQELKRQLAELGLSKAGQEARKVLPIEIDQEKRKRKEPSKFDENSTAK